MAKRKTVSTIDYDPSDDTANLSNYSAWLEETGLDDSFVDTADRYEAACKRMGVVPDWE